MSGKSKLKDHALAILKSIAFEYNEFPRGPDWEVQPLTRLNYWRIKAMAIEYLSMSELDNLQKLEEKLANTFHFVDSGKEHFEIKSSDGVFSDGDINQEYIEVPPTMCLDRVEWELLKDDTPTYFFENYLLLVLMNLAKFETMMDKIASNSHLDRQYIIDDLFESLNILMEAQVALELGIASYERSGGRVSQKKYEFFRHTYAPGIKAQQGRNKSNQARKEESRNKKRPLLREIHQLVTKEGLGVTAATGEVAAKHGFSDPKNIDTLMHAYYDYRKDPGNY